MNAVFHASRSADLVGEERERSLSPTSLPADAGEGHDPIVAALFEAMGKEFGADALLVGCHWAQGGSTVLCSAAARPVTPRAGQQMAGLATSLAARATGSGQFPIAHNRTLPDEQWALAIPLAEGVVTVAGHFERKNPAAQAARQWLTRVLPVLQPFFAMWAASRSASARSAALIAAIEQSDVPTMVVSRAGEVLFANAASERLFAAKEELHRRGGKLSGATLADTLRLQAALEHLFNAGDSRSSRPVVALRRARRRPILVTLLPVTTPGDPLQQQAAIAHVFDPEHDLTRIIKPVCDLYNLSVSESRLACSLAAGASLAEAAAIMGVREQTARSCLKQVFLKTETNRQAELVWLLLKSAVRVSEGDKMQVF